MKQNMNKTVAILNAITDLLINIASIYAAIWFLEYNADFFGGRTVAVSTCGALASVVLYFVCDMYSTSVLDKLHKIIIKLVGAQIFMLSVLVVKNSVGNTILALTIAMITYFFCLFKFKIFSKRDTATFKYKV